MNGNRLDNLFEQKLGNHKLTPPPGSWDQIENNLKEDKNKGVALWIKVAASFLLLLTAGWFIIQADKAPQENSVAKIVKEVQPDLATQDTNGPNTTQAPVINSNDADQIIESKATDESVKRLLAQSTTTKKEVLKEINPPSEKVFLKEIAPLELALSTPNLTVSIPHHSQVLPMDISLMYTYAIEKNEEVKKSRKFRMLNGIISIAKGVNKSKLGFEDIRSAKNGFVNDELKYGNKKTEDVVEEGDTNSDDLNK